VVLCDDDGTELARHHDFSHNTRRYRIQLAEALARVVNGEEWEIRELPLNHHSFRA
jgi:hypothetical protein